MVLATRYFIDDQKAAAAFFAKRMVEEKMPGPANNMKRAAREFEGMTNELDSWGEVNGRP